MTRLGYNERASYCIDLLVLAGLLRWGIVHKDGTIESMATCLGKEEGESIGQLLRAGEDDMVRGILIAILCEERTIPANLSESNPTSLPKNRA